MKFVIMQNFPSYCHFRFLKSKPPLMKEDK